jgi:hypothetical protein
VVEVPAGTVPVSVPLSVVVPAEVVSVLPVPRPDEPPPAGVVAPLPESELPVVLEPTVEPLAVLLLPESVELVPFDPVLELLVFVDAAAVLDGGTVSVGAPLVSVVPLPLPPQAASTAAARIAAPPAAMARK